MSYSAVADRLEAAFGRRLSPSTFARWCRVGVTVRGRTVRLRAVRLGGQWNVSPESLAEFLRDLGNEEVTI